MLLVTRSMPCFCKDSICLTNWKDSSLIYLLQKRILVMWKVLWRRLMQLSTVVLKLYFQRVDNVAYLEGKRACTNPPTISSHIWFRNFELCGQQSHEVHIACGLLEPYHFPTIIWIISATALSFFSVIVAPIVYHFLCNWDTGIARYWIPFSFHWHATVLITEMFFA